MDMRERWRQHHPYEALEVDAVSADRVDADDSRIIDRIVTAYRKSSGTDYYGPDSIWRIFREERHRDLHELLLHGPREKLAEALRSPRDNNLLYGFEMLFKERIEEIEADPRQTRIIGARLKDQLVCLAEALGALRVENPESGPWLESLNRPVPELVAAVEGKLGFSLDLPAFYAGLLGLPMRNGVLTYRMIHAAYCASRVKALTSGTVLEIGGGIGHLACYAHRLGLHITIVDLPMTNVAQGYFLMRTLGEEAVVLEGEPVRAGSINVLTPAHLDRAPRYDLVVNVDSLTEVGSEVAKGYLRWIAKNSGRFWSVNHEVNAFTVNELLREFSDVTVERFPYWMRNGYVEESVRF
jgi:hypothetical protein